MPAGNIYNQSVRHKLIKLIELIKHKIEKHYAKEDIICTDRRAMLDGVR